MIPYFFISTNKIAQIPKIKSLGAKELIIDFEDSLTQEQQFKLQSVFEDLDNYTQYWYRVPMRNNFDQNINTDYLNHFIQNGINKIVLPKVKNKQELS